MSELAAYEEDLERAKTAIERRDAVDRLMKNEDFKLIIKKGFCEDEVLRCNNLAVHELTSEAQRVTYSRMVQASGILTNYLNAISTMGNTAEMDIPTITENIYDQRSKLRQL